MKALLVSSALGLGLLLTAGGVSSASARTPQETAARPAGGQGASSVTVRLVTGDRVTVTPGTAAFTGAMTAGKNALLCYVNPSPGIMEPSSG